MLFNSASILAFLACASFTSAEERFQIPPASSAELARAYKLIQNGAVGVIKHQNNVADILKTGSPNQANEVHKELLGTYDVISIMKNGLSIAAGSTNPGLLNVTLKDCSYKFAELINSLQATCLLVLGMKFVDEFLHEDFQNITSMTVAALNVTDKFQVTERLFIQYKVNETELKSLPDGFPSIAEFLETFD